MKYVNIHKNSAQIRFGEKTNIIALNQGKSFLIQKPWSEVGHWWMWPIRCCCHRGNSRHLHLSGTTELMTWWPVYIYICGWFWCQHTGVKGFQLNFGQCMFRSKHDRKEVVESQLWSEEENSPYLHSYICPYSFHPKKIFPTSEVFRFSLKTPEMRLRCSMRRLACHCVGCLQNDK